MTLPLYPWLPKKEPKNAIVKGVVSGSAGLAVPASTNEKGVQTSVNTGSTMPNLDSLITQLKGYTNPLTLENERFRTWLDARNINLDVLKPWENDADRGYTLTAKKINTAMMRDVNTLAPYTPPTNTPAKTYQGYWENPYRVARYYDLIQQMPDTWVPPDWLNVPAIESAYKYLSYKNNNEPWVSWETPAADDPVMGLLQSLPVPPVSALTSEEQLYLDPKVKAEQERIVDPYAQYAQPVESFYDLPWYGQAAQVLAGPQGGAPDRPLGNKILAAAGTALLPALSAAKLGSIAGPWGAVILGGITFAAMTYQNITGEKVPVIGDVFNAFNYLGQQTEIAGGIIELAEVEGLTKVLQNWDASVKTAELAYETGAGGASGGLFGALTGYIKGGLPGAAIGGLIGHEVGNVEFGKGIINAMASLSGDEAAGPDEMWNFSKGYAEPIPVLNRTRDGIGPVGKYALSESFNRIINEKEDPTLVFTDMIDRFGDSGNMNNFMGQMLFDPIQYAAYFSDVVGLKGSEWGASVMKAAEARGIKGFASSDDFAKLAELFKVHTGEPLIDMLPMGAQQLTQWVTGIKGSDGILPVFADYKNWIRTGFEPPSVRQYRIEQIKPPIPTIETIKYDLGTQSLLDLPENASTVITKDTRGPNGETFAENLYGQEIGVTLKTTIPVGDGTNDTVGNIAIKNGINIENKSTAEVLTELRTKLPLTQEVVPAAVTPVTSDHYVAAKDLSKFSKTVAYLTGEGLPKEMLPEPQGGGITGKFKRFFTLEPDAQASLLQSNIIDSIAVMVHAVDDPTMEPLPRLQRMMNVIKKYVGVKAGDVGNISEQLFESPYAAMAQKSIQMGMDTGWLNEMYKSFETSLPAIMKIKDLSGLFTGADGKPVTATQFLNDLAKNPENVWKMLVDKGVTEFANKEALTKMFDPFLVKKSANGKLKDMVPASVEEWRVKVLATMFDKSSTAMAKYYSLKPDSTFWRFADVLKQAQNILLLDVNIGYPIRNWMNNVVTRVVEGQFGNYPMERIMDWVERTGVSLTRMTEGFTMSSSGSEFTDLYSGIQKAMQTNDGLQKLIYGMKKFRNVIGFASQWAGKIESSESARSYGIGMMQYWGKIWKPGLGYTEMPFELRKKLSDIDPDLPKLIQNVIDTKLNPSEIEYKLLTKKLLNLDVENFAMDAAKKISPDNPESMIELLREVGATANDKNGEPIGLAKDLASADTPEKVNSVIGKIKTEINNNLTKKLADLTEVLSEHEAARNKAEGPTAIVRTIMDTLRDEMSRLSGKRMEDAEFAENAATMDLSTKQLKINELRAAQSADWEDWFTQNHAKLKGQLKAYGFESAFTDKLLNLWDSIHKANNKFYNGTDVADIPGGPAKITPIEGSELAQSTKPLAPETPPVVPPVSETFKPLAPQTQTIVGVDQPWSMSDEQVNILLKTPDSQVAKPTDVESIAYFKGNPKEPFIPDVIFDADYSLKKYSLKIDELISDVENRLGTEEAARFALTAAHQALGGEVPPEVIAKYPELENIPIDKNIVADMYKYPVETPIGGQEIVQPNVSQETLPPEQPGVSEQPKIGLNVADGEEINAVHAQQNGINTTHIDGKYDLLNTFFRVDHGNQFWADWTEMRAKESALAANWHQERVAAYQEVFTTLADMYKGADGQPNASILARGEYIISTMSDQFAGMDNFYRYVDGLRGKENSAELVRKAWKTYNDQVHTPIDAKLQNAKMEIPFIIDGSPTPDWAALPLDDTPEATIKRIVNAQSIVDAANQGADDLAKKSLDMADHPELYGHKDISAMTPEELDNLHKIDIEATSKQETADILNTIRRQTLDNAPLTEKQKAYVALMQQINGVIETTTNAKNQMVNIPAVVEVYVENTRVQMPTRNLMLLAGAKEDMADMWQIDQQKWTELMTAKAGQMTTGGNTIEFKIPKDTQEVAVEPYDKDGMTITKHIVKGKKQTVVAIQDASYQPTVIQTRNGYVYYIGMDPDHSNSYIYMMKNKLYSTFDVADEFKVKIPAAGITPPETFDVELHNDYDANKQMLDKHMPTLLGQLGDEIKASFGKKTLSLANLDDATNEQLTAWVNQVKTDMTSAKMATMRYGEYARDAALLNYKKQYGGDKILGLFAPYEFWATRTAWNWAGRMIDKPGWFAAYAKYRELQQRMEEKGMPSRLYGKVKMPAPYMPDWAGGNLFFDPLKDLFPPATYDLAFQQFGKQDANIVSAANQILYAKFDNKEISKQDMDDAIANKKGYIWDSAYTQASSESDNKADPMSLISMALSPALYLDIPSKIAAGTPEKIGTLPGTREGLAIQAALSDTPLKFLGDITAGIMSGPETTIRKAAGLSNYGEWGPYYIDRMLSNMATEPGRDVNQILLAMNEHKGPLFDEASARVAQEMSVKIPGVSAIYLLKGLFSGRLDRLEKVGFSALSLFGTVFSSSLLPEGELKQRGLYEKYIDAIKQSEQGNDKAFTKFFDQYPEYRARLALYDKPEERLRNFLVNGIWEQYYKIPQANRSLVANQLGDLFQTAFLNGNTRSYESIDVASLAYWAKVLKTTVPDTEQTAAVTKMPQATLPALTGYPTQLATAIQAYRSERTDKFPNYYALQTEYYENGRSKTFLNKFPELKEYWNWNRDYKASHPELQPYLDELAAQQATPQFGENRVPIEFAPETVSDADMKKIDPILVKQLTYYFYGNTPLTTGAEKELTRLWNSWGKPGGTMEYFLDNILRSSFVK